MNYLFLRATEDGNGSSVTSTQQKIILFICFLPIYVVSAFFRITTFVMLFTYLNVWTFCPMIMSWILNISSVRLTKTTCNTTNSTFAYKHTNSLLAATIGVFIPICVIEPAEGKKML